MALLSLHSNTVYKCIQLSSAPGRQKLEVGETFGRDKEQNILPTELDKRMAWRPCSQSMCSHFSQDATVNIILFEIIKRPLCANKAESAKDQ